MPRNLGRNLNRCFTKIKAPASPLSSTEGDHSRSLSNSAASILIKNFNSLYDFTIDCTSHSKSFPQPTTTSDDEDNLSSSASSEDTATTPDFATAFASQRFFFSTPGRSNSIVDSSSLSSLASTSSSSPGNPPEPDSIVGGSIAIPTYSPDPFVDFRRSMQEMVEAHDLNEVRGNWDYLHELLTCYLSLNPKSTHKFIVGAFSDLLVTLMTSSSAKDDDDVGCRCTKSKLSDDIRKISHGRK
ncbi:hypothetical protein ACH5RR_020178 [Cinchona calisaya]|uniref:Transcription repressor n=1 Tax=Cinchona calisaya TaxID=153742 RepID=A0ABD2ZDN9_9GENT